MVRQPASSGTSAGQRLSAGLHAATAINVSVACVHVSESASRCVHAQCTMRHAPYASSLNVIKNHHNHATNININIIIMHILQHEQIILDMIFIIACILAIIIGLVVAVYYITK